MRNVSSYNSNRRLRKLQHLVTITPSTALSAKQITPTDNVPTSISFVTHSKVLLLLICVPLALFVLTLILRSIRKRKQNATEFVNQRCPTYRRDLSENLKTFSIDDEPMIGKLPVHDSTISTSEPQPYEPPVVYRLLEKSSSGPRTPQIISTISPGTSTSSSQLLIERTPCILSTDHARDSFVSHNSQLVSSAYPDTDASTINDASIFSLDDAIRLLQSERDRPLLASQRNHFSSSSASSESVNLYLLEIIKGEIITPPTRSLLPTDDEESCI